MKPILTARRSGDAPVRSFVVETKRRRAKPTPAPVPALAAQPRPQDDEWYGPDLAEACASARKDSGFMDPIPNAKHADIYNRFMTSYRQAKRGFDQDRQCTLAAEMVCMSVLSNHEFHTPGNPINGRNVCALLSEHAENFIQCLQQGQGKGLSSDDKRTLVPAAVIKRVLSSLAINCRSSVAFALMTAIHHPELGLYSEQVISPTREMRRETEYVNGILKRKAADRSATHFD
ncbi:MAG: hypothetical protein AB7G06_06390 [Bdellovibrionales bacterium]